MKELILKSETLSENNFIASHILLFTDQDRNSFTLKCTADDKSVVDKMIKFVHDNCTNHNILPIYELMVKNSYVFKINGVDIDYSRQYSQSMHYEQDELYRMN